MSSSRHLLEQWLIETVRLIVDDPTDITLHSFEDMGRVTFQIRARRTEVGKLIGKQGRHADSIRILMRAMGKKIGMAFNVEFVVQETQGTLTEEA
jgi:uncharacterized protein